MRNGVVVGDEDRDGEKSRSCENLLALEKTLSFTLSEKGDSE